MSKQKTKAEWVAEKGEQWYYEHIYLRWKKAHEKRQQQPGYQEMRSKKSMESKKRRYDRDPEYKLKVNKHKDFGHHKNRWKNYCKEYWLIENYDKALADNFKGWHCHHRLELHPDGSIRFTREGLINADLYVNRPPEELIFLTISEHSKLHGVNRHKYE